MKPHAFVAMPFGTKEDVDFNSVYQNLIKPALENAGFDVFRADEEQRAGSIIPDMFQELLLSDLVVVDLSIDNPNVWYELGVRHALRPRGVIQIQAKREHLPFDVYVERALRYHLKHGLPDDAYLEEDRRKLADFATATMNAWHDRKVSPVYSLLPSLEPPEWKRLRVGNMNEFWDAQERWERRVRIAQKAGRVGDILVFAGEAPTRVLQLEARLAAAAALLDLEEFKFSLEQYELALELEPEDLKARQKKGIVLGRLQRYSEAEEWLRAVARDHPDDGETWGLLGRVEKDAWISKWRKPGCSPQQMRQDAFLESALLKRAIDAYTSGFAKSPANFYPGINALALSCLLEHLTGSRMKMPERQALEGGVLWAIRCALKKDPDDYWAKATLGDLVLLNDQAKNIKDLYGEAIASPQKNRFALRSTLQQIRLMKDLEFRSAELSAAEEVFEKALADLPIPEKLVPRHLFLFSGHMVDLPNRPLPRFPADKEPIAAQAIRAKLDELHAGPQDLAFCSGACGGDLLFAEACLERGLGLRVRIPFTEPEFLSKSVRFAGERWVDRFLAVKADSKATILPMPDVLGPLPKGIDAFSRNNLWQLYSALSWGPEKVNFLCLWNRQEGDGPGGTKHMYDTVTGHAGQVSVLDTTKLW